MTRKIPIIVILLATAVAVKAQNSAELRARYGEPLTTELKNNRPTVERFAVRPNIIMTIRYTARGEPLEALLEPAPNSTPKTDRREHAPEGDYMVTLEVIKLINEVLPIEKRGKTIIAGSMNGGDPQMKLHHPGCAGLYFVSFENASVACSTWCWGGTFSATIHWGKSPWLGQTTKIKKK